MVLKCATGLTGYLFAFGISSSSWLLIMNLYLLVKSSITFVETSFERRHSSYLPKRNRSRNLISCYVPMEKCISWLCFDVIACAKKKRKKKNHNNFRFLLFQPNFQEILLTREGSFPFSLLCTIKYDIKKILLLRGIIRSLRNWELWIGSHSFAEENCRSL